MLQDKRGFIWIGTNDGLNRYDGLHFTIFRNIPSDSSTLSGNIITDILEDSSEILWIATADGGITKYNYKLPPARQFKQYKHNDSVASSIPVNGINALLLYRQKYLWIVSSGAGALRFDIKKEHFEIVNNGINKTYTDLCFDNDNMIWAGKQGGGYSIIHPETMHERNDQRYSNVYAKLPHMAVNCLLHDDNNIWLGSWDHLLFRINSMDKSETVYAPGKTANSFTSDEVLSMINDSHGNLWLGGKTTGLQYFDKKTGLFYRYSYDASRAGTLANNRINCLFFDNTGMLWVGTDKGLSVSNPAINQFKQTFLENVPAGPISIYDFFRDIKTNTIWIGTSNGLYKQSADNTIVHVPVTFHDTLLAVSKFFKDPSDGTVYLGTNLSVFRFDINAQSVSLLPNTDKDVVIRKIIDSRVVSILKDTIQNHPVLVVLPYGHYLTWYDFTEQRWYSRKDSIKNIVNSFGLKDHLVRKIEKAANGYWYMGTGKQGLGVWQRPLHQKVNYLTNNPSNYASISSNNVYDFVTAGSGNFWISTFGGGLNFYNSTNNKFQHVVVSPNLSEGIASDNNGNIWGISNGSLYRYEIKTASLTSFELPDVEKSGGVKGNIFKEADGSMVVAGDNYFIRFNPLLIQQQVTIPKIYFTDFKIYNTSYSHLLQQQEMALSYKQNYFSFEFAAPSFIGTQQVKYYAKMDGEENDWTDLGNRNFISYNNLPGGHHTFRIKAVTADNRQSESSLLIVILPPIWKRWWFYLLCAVLLSGIIYVIYRYRINELLKRQEIRNRIAQDLHDSVGSTLSSISVYSQVAKIYNQKEKKVELQDTLEKIGSTSGEMISEMSDIVWAINPRNDGMEKILQRMESFARPLLKTKEISCTFDYDPAITKLHLPMEKRKNFYLIFKEAINNILKYADCSSMEFSLKQKENLLELIIKDNGKGFDMNVLSQHSAKSLSGNGLDNMKRRAAEMNGTCVIDSERGKGTSIKLKFPIT